MQHTTARTSSPPSLYIRCLQDAARLDAHAVCISFPLTLTLHLTDRSAQDASSCLDAWAFLCQLLANPAVAERCPAAAASLEMLSVSWRKMHMNAMEQATLTAAAVVLQVGSLVG